MKKIVFFTITLLISSAVLAQTKFTIPELSDSQKLQTARNLGYNNIVAAINFAKSQGFSAEEYGTYEGNLFPWNKELGFEGWVNSFLYMNTAMVGNIEILNQTENMISIRMSQIYPAFEKRGEMMDVTYEEFMNWYDKMFIQIFKDLGCKYVQNTTDEGVEISIEKK